MKGVILAGGKGTRMMPLTAVTNKHLIPVGKLPMIEYPLFTLGRLGVSSISVVTGGEHFQNISAYLSGMHQEINFSYHDQREAGGIAQALSLTEPYLGNKRIAVILGDNIFEGDFSECAKKFEDSDFGAMLFLKEVGDPERFGVAELGDGRVVGIEEKPSSPKSNFAVTGLYFYDATVFDKIRKLRPSGRGELEITDVNNQYVEEGELGYQIVEGFWSDAGTHESRNHCEQFVRGGLEQEVWQTLKFPD